MGTAVEPPSGPAPDEPVAASDEAAADAPAAGEPVPGSPEPAPDADLEPGPGPEPGPAAAAPQPRNVGRIVSRSLLVATLVVVLAGCWFAFRAWQASTALQDARAALGDLPTDVDRENVARFGATLPAVQASLDRARSATSDPVWRVAGFLPWVGDDLRAVRTVSRELDELVRTARPAVDGLGAVLDAEQTFGEGGEVDLEPLASAAPALRTAAAAADHADVQVSAIDVDGLVHPLVEPVRQVQDVVGSLSATIGTGAQVATLVPPMLGADGPRTYLVAALNSAELRSAGGIVGSVGVLQADDGKLRFDPSPVADDLDNLGEPVLPLTDEELALETDRLGAWIQDAVLTPDFPRAAELIAARWEKSVGGHVDGVVAVDAVTTKYLLGATGPVTTKAGTTLQADDVLRQVLHDVYLTSTNPDADDEFNAQLADAVFDAIVAGQGSGARGVVDALARATSEGRVRLWSAHPDEQRTLVGTRLGAAFLRGAYGADAGVFLDDSTAGKLDYFLSTRYEIVDLRCTGPDPAATVTVTLDYDPPADVASYPRYVTGYGDGFAPGTLRTRVSVFAPTGAPLGALRLGTGYVSGKTGTYEGRRVQAVSSVLEPGQSATYTFTVPVRGDGVHVWTTPTLTSPGHVEASCG